MLDINVKNATNILNDRDNQIIASNKSKAKLSIIDKIKTYYYQRKLDAIDVKIDEVEEDKQVFGDAMKEQEEKFNQLADEGEFDKLSQIDKDYSKNKKSFDETNKELEDLNEQRNMYQEKLDDINTKVEPELEPIAPIDSVSDEMVESAMQKAQEKLKNDVESMSMEQVKEETKKSPIEAILDEYKVRDNELFKALIERIEKVYVDLTIQKVDKIQAEANKMLTESNNVITGLNSKVDSLASELATTKQNLEQTSNELTQTKNKVSEQEQTIMDLNISINAKDEEIKAKDEEIARLRPLDELFSQVGNYVAQKNSAQDDKEQTKTL